MSKIFSILLIVLTLFALQFTPLVKETYAVNCTADFYDSADLSKTITPNQNMGDLSVRISSNSLSTNSYDVKVQYPGMRPNETPYLGINVKFTNPGPSDPFTIRKTYSGWRTGPYIIYFYRSGGDKTDPNASCHIEFTITPLSPQTCSIVVSNSPMDPGTGAVMTVSGIANGTYDITVNDKLLSDWGRSYHIYDTKIGSTVDIGTFPSGGDGPAKYTIKLFKTGECPWWQLGDLLCQSRPQCVSDNFFVYPTNQVPAKTPSKNSDCSVSPPLASQVDPIFLVAKNLSPKTKFSAARADTSGEVFLVATDPSYSNFLTSSDQGTISIPLVEAPGNSHPLGVFTAYLYDASHTEVCEKSYTVQDEKNIAAQKLIELKQCLADRLCVRSGGEVCLGDTSNRGPGIKTAIGCIHTNPAEFVKDVMTWIIGIGGGLAFLMMLLGAFQMLTSAGNPETLAAGKSRLTSAVIGLLFIIFSVLLLKIIGVDILGLPGFER